MNWIAKYFLQKAGLIAGDFDERLSLLEGHVGRLLTQQRRSRLRDLRDDPMVEEAVAALRASAPASTDGMPDPVSTAEHETKGPTFLRVARKARS